MREKIEAKKNFGTAMVSFLLLGLIIFTAGCGRKKEMKSQAYPVKVIKAEFGEMEDCVYLNGTLVAENEAYLSPKISGRIAEIYAEEGQAVSKGEALLKLEDAEFVAQLGMAKARLNQAKEGSNFQNITTSLQIKDAQVNFDDAKTDYRRMESLFNKGAISRQQLEDVKLRYDLAATTLEHAKSSTSQNIIQKENIASALEQVQQAQAQLNNTVIYAPFDGVITRKNCKVGQFVSSGSNAQDLFQIVNNSNIFFEGFVAEMDIAKVHAGQKAKVEVYALNKTFDSKVSSISEASDPTSRSLHVRISLKDVSSKLNSGLAASAQIVIETYTGIILPSYIIRNDGKRYFVVVPQKGMAKFKTVKVGLKDENYALVTEGLQKDEPVISMGHETLKDGDALTIE